MTRLYRYWFPLLLFISAQRVFSEPFAVCEALPPLAGTLSQSDTKVEEAYCNIAFEGDSTAFCPKTWSTSPAALLYDLRGTEWQGKAADFEQRFCRPGGKARDKASRELAFFKNSLNGRETSGTFAPASLIYYHMSRLLQTRIQVPVAVPVSFDGKVYRARLVTPGVEYSSQGSRKMLHSGWLEMDAALASPTEYSHKRELFIDEGRRLWGVLLMPEGRRYNAELNGTRASGWGEGQNRDFQRTGPFLALRTDAPLAEAIEVGIEQARLDPAMADVLPRAVAPAQVAWWMHEITEIVLLDYILGQQDRIGNVDYLERWVWLENGELRSTAGQPQQAAIRLRRSVLNDNDAGVRSGYANYARSTGMLEGWRHIDPGLYQRVQALGEDFRAEGPIASAIRERYRLSRREADRVIQRGIAAASYLQEQCVADQLRFDLAVANVLDPATAQPAAPACGAATESG